jgi:peptidoglycan/LPS O-acetylase OafA/YrhL
MVLKEKAERIPIMDGVRGFAALWVLLGHVSNFTGLQVPLLSSPFHAVDVFMLMSGFLMAQHFLLRRDKEPWESPRTHLIFYVRRFFRIAPLYYAMLIPAVIWHSYYSGALSSLMRSMFTTVYDPSEITMTATNLVVHLSFLFGLFPQYCANLIIPDWSIGLEMQFYAMFPLLMLFARRFGLVVFSLGSIAVWELANQLIAVRVINTPKMLGLFPQPSFLPLKLVYFTSGILLAWGYMEDRESATKRSTIAILAIASVAITGSAVMVCVVVALLLLLFNRPEKRRAISTPLGALEFILGNRFAAFLGDTSYGVYLVHMLLLIPALSLIRTTSHLSRFLLVSAIVAPLCYAISWALSWMVENPGIALGKRIAQAIPRPARKSSAFETVISDGDAELDPS